MKKNLVLVMILMLVVACFGVTLTQFTYKAFTLDRSVSPQLLADVESVFVVLYRDNGTTAIDSGYTDDFGNFRTLKLYKNDGYMRVLASKTGYATEWSRFNISQLDTTADTTYVVPIRMRSNIGDSTFVLTAKLVNADGSPAVGVVVQARVSAPFIGTAGGGLFPSGDYGIVQAISDAGGIAELDILANSCCELWIAGTRRFASFQMDSTRDLGNIVLKP
jgi:hypothetical protein